jgi:hypothetical protein
MALVLQLLLLGLILLTAPLGLAPFPSFLLLLIFGRKKCVVNMIIIIG